MATEAQHRGSERQQPDGCAESSSESSDEESDDEGVGRSSLEASAMMCRDLLSNLGKQAKAVRKAMKSLPDRTKEENIKHSKASRARTKLESRLFDRHSKLVSQLVQAQKDLKEVQKLQEAADGTASKQSFTKVPPATDPDRPVLTITMDLQDLVLDEFFDDLEQYYGPYKFPKTEKVAGEIHNRWSNQLPTHLKNLSKQDKFWLKKICGGCGKPWEFVKSQVRQRFVRILDEFANCVYLENLHQEAGQGVASYTEAFAAAVDRTRRTLSDWKETDDYFTFQMLKQADPILRDAVTSHDDYNKRGTKTDYTKMTALMVKCESILAGTSTFSAARGARTSALDSGRDRSVRSDATTEQQQLPEEEMEERFVTGDNMHMGGNSPSELEDEAPQEPRQRPIESCGRCGRSNHTVAMCKSQFNEAGFAIAGKPPGQPDGWISHYKGCRTPGCGSMDHKLSACPKAT
jgi:hypothetical protein